MHADHDPDLMRGGCSQAADARVPRSGDALSEPVAGVAPVHQTTSTPTCPAESRAAVAVAAQAGRKRAKRPDLDYDAKIKEAARNIKEMGKAMAAAKSAQKNERRKKQRLVKKASTLSPEDLERIAVLKRCGLWSADGQSPIASPTSDASTGGQYASRSADSAPVMSPGVAVVGTVNVCSTSPKLHIEDDTAGQPEDEIAGGLE